MAAGQSLIRTKKTIEGRLPKEGALLLTIRYVFETRFCTFKVCYNKKTMKKELTRKQEIERSIIKTYRSKLWTPFIRGIKRYELINEGDRIAVCISGGKDSMLLAKLIEELCRHSDVSFSARYIVMDPGYNKENRDKIEENAKILGIPIEVFETDIFKVANATESSPCYLCARMRRGALYARAKEIGCNKIALGHHLNDVIETTVMSMFYSSQIRAMLPKLHSQNFEGMELIRPLYLVREEDIIRWANHNDLEFIRCACRFTENTAASDKEDASKRLFIKNLIKDLKENNPDIEDSILNSIHSVCLDTMPGYKANGETHLFLEDY